MPPMPPLLARAKDVLHAVAPLLILRACSLQPGCGPLDSFVILTPDDLSSPPSPGALLSQCALSAGCFVGVEGDFFFPLGLALPGM